MTLRSRLALASPVWRFAVGRSREAARLAAKVRELERDLAVVRADRDALRSHFELARSQRDGARELLAAIAGEPPCGPTEAEYDEFLRSLGERPA